MSATKLKLSAVLELNAALGELAKLARGPRLSYAIAKNLGRLAPELRSIEKAKEPSAEFQKVDAERQHLAAKHSKKGEDGGPLTAVAEQNGVAIPGQRVFVLENQAAFEAEFKAFREEHAETIAARDAQLAAWREMLETDTVVELHAIPLSLVEGDAGVEAGGSAIPLAEILRPLIGTVITEE